MAYVHALISCFYDSTNTSQSSSTQDNNINLCRSINNTRIPTIGRARSGLINDPLDNLPIGFSWAETLTTKPYKNKYVLTMLLHGECLKYGLASYYYKEKYGIDNPYARFLKIMSEKDVKIIICNLCLNKDGFNASQLLEFIEPIPFSIDYILQYQKNWNNFVVYDAQL